MTLNIKDITMLCIDNGVDVEIFSAVNESNPNKPLRTAALITLDEVVRVDFGEKKYGYLVSRIHLANNHKVIIPINDLISGITSYENTKRWKGGSNSNNNPLPRSVTVKEEGNVVTVEGTLSEMFFGVPNAEHGEAVALTVTAEVCALVGSKPVPQKMTDEVHVITYVGDLGDVDINDHVIVTGSYKVGHGIIGTAIEKVTE